MYRFLTHTAILAAFVVGGAAGSFATPAATSSFSSPAQAPAQVDAGQRTLAERYFGALAARDENAFAALWAPSAAEALKARRDALRPIFTSVTAVTIDGLAVRPVSAGANDGATLRVTATVKYGRTSQQMTRLLSLQPVAGEVGNWRITRDLWAWEDLAGAVAATKTEPERESLAKRAADEGATPGELTQIWLRASGKLPPAEADRALALTDRARREAEARSDDVTLDDVLSTQVMIRYRQGRFPEAMEVIQQLLSLRERMANQVGMAKAYTMMGGVHYGMNRLSDAQKAFERARDIYVTLGDTESATSMLNNIAVMRDDQGDLEGAMQTYRECLVAFEKLGDKHSMAAVSNNLGGLYRRRGELRQALALYDRSVTLYRENGEPQEAAGALNNIGGLYMSQGDWAQSVEYLKRALALHEGAGNTLSAAQTWGNLAQVYRLWNRFDLAADAAQKSLAVYEKTNNPLASIVPLHALGTVYAARREWAAARDAIRRSLKLAEEAGRTDEAAEALASLAWVEKEAGNNAEAATLAERAADAAEKAQQKESEWKAAHVAGRAYRDLKQTERARRWMERAVAVVEWQRGEIVGGAQSRQRAFEVLVGPYMSLVGLTLDLGQPAEALQWAERAKSRSLLEILQSATDPSTSEGGAGVPLERSTALNPTERARVRSQRSALTALNAQITRERAQPAANLRRLNDLEEQRRKLQLESEAYQTSLYATHPDLQVRLGEIPPLTLAQASQLLPADGKTAIVEFVVGDDATYALVLTRGPKTAGGGTGIVVRGYTLPLRKSRLAERTRGFREQMARRDLGFTAASRALYDLLLGPAARELKDKKALIVVPDGPLWELPFQALQPRTGRYLVDEMAVSYAPSLTALRAMRARRRGEGGTGQSASPARSVSALVAVGNPALPSGTPRGAGGVLRAGAFAPLPKAEEEVKALAGLYGRDRSRLFVGLAAREESVKAAFPQARVLHLATHGVLNNSAPLHSYVLLAQITNGATGGEDPEDGLLEAREMMGMRLNADLVVLSACETALGYTSAGEGVIGLSWALFAAGCPSTVVSQWKVDSESTGDLMVRFHQFLRHGDNKAVALQKAGEALRKDPRYRHPFYWAGFVVMGDYQ